MVQGKRFCRTKRDSQCKWKHVSHTDGTDLQSCCLAPGITALALTCGQQGVSSLNFCCGWVKQFVSFWKLAQWLTRHWETDLPLFVVPQDLRLDKRLQFFCSRCLSYPVIQIWISSVKYFTHWEPQQTTSGRYVWNVNFFLFLWACD